jgi:hypothetical protein
VRNLDFSLGGGIDAQVDKSLRGFVRGIEPFPSEDDLRKFLNGEYQNMDWLGYFVRNDKFPGEEERQLCNLQARELLSFALGALEREEEYPYIGRGGCFTLSKVDGRERVLIEMEESPYFKLLCRTKPDGLFRGAAYIDTNKDGSSGLFLFVHSKPGETFSHALAAELFNLHISGIGFAYDGGGISADSREEIRAYWWTALNAAINGRVGFCEHCGKPFATSNERGKLRKYCSDTCRNNHGNKKFRAKHRKRKPPRALAPDGSATLK